MVSGKFSLWGMIWKIIQTLGFLKAWSEVDMYIRNILKIFLWEFSGVILFK